VNVNKRFILGSALALAAVATVIGGVAAAQSAGESSDKPKDQVIEKAAEQLGVDPTTLQDALKQARQQVMLEKLDEYLAKAVTDGKITQAEADAIKAWIQARPAAVDKLGKGMFGFPGMHGRGGHHGPSRHARWLARRTRRRRRPDAARGQTARRAGPAPASRVRRRAPEWGRPDSR
jgi:hypothetical protein